MSNKHIKLTLDVEIEERWLPEFAAFLQCCQVNSKIGHSSWVGLYADGDGDFYFRANAREVDLEKVSEPAKYFEEHETSVEYAFDAG